MRVFGSERETCGNTGFVVITVFIWFHSHANICGPSVIFTYLLQGFYSVHAIVPNIILTYGNSLRVCLPISSTFLRISNDSDVIYKDMQVMKTIGVSSWYHVIDIGSIWHFWVTVILEVCVSYMPIVLFLGSINLDNILRMMAYCNWDCMWDCVDRVMFVCKHQHRPCPKETPFSGWSIL